MTSTLVALYLAAAAVTSLILYVASVRLADHSRPVMHRVALSATAGMLWPILLLGVVEVGWVALYVKTGEPDDEPRIDVMI